MDSSLGNSCSRGPIRVFCQGEISFLGKRSNFFRPFFDVLSTNSFCYEIRAPRFLRIRKNRMKTAQETGKRRMRTKKVAFTAAHSLFFLVQSYTLNGTGSRFHPERSSPLYSTRWIYFCELYQSSGVSSLVFQMGRIAFSCRRHR
jgi:hypothetical protein